ncbi:hypothetical protein RA27_14120 [Ruegeria sp. ANG-R]|nr:hypothetical protein RA27_14120 [Ruegeria sp. ANG-R]
MIRCDTLGYQLSEYLRQNIIFLLMAFASCVLPSLAVASEESKVLSGVSSRCVQTLLKLDGGRVFEGAEFQNFRKGRVFLTVDNVPVSIVLNADRFSGHRETCSFQTADSAKLDWGFFAAQLTNQMEQIGLERQRPYTETNFKFSGCTEAEYGRSYLIISALYLSKSKQVVYSARSQRSDVEKCA